MVFMGSKAKYADEIVPILQKIINKNNITTYIEPFCLSKSQQVYTENGVKTIEELEIGDKIYDDIGNLVTVVNKIKSLDIKGKEITLKGNVKIVATNNHKFYLQDGTEISVRNLKKDDVLSTGININTKNPIIDLSNEITISNSPRFGRSGKIIDENHIKLYHNAPITPRYIPVTKELMWCYGLVVAEGDKSNLTMHKDEINYLQQFIDNYSRILNIDLSSQQKFYVRKNSCQLAIPYKTIYEKLFFKAMNIGYGAHNKNISFLFKCTPEMTREALKAMFIGDGCLRIKNDKYRSLNYKTCSKILAYQLQTLLMTQFKIKSTLSTGENKERFIDDRTLKPSIYYNISITKDSDIEKIIEIKNKYNIQEQNKKEGFYIIDIKEIEDEFYDITVDNNSHKFILDGGIVTHNCGGANIIDKIKCENRIGYDRSETLIALLRQAQEDFSKVLDTPTREKWDEGKAYVKDGTPLTTMSLADVGAMEFLASYSCGGFPRGYMGGPCRQFISAYNNLKTQAPLLKDIYFETKDYKDFPQNIQGALIYCDPPYQGTKQYQYASVSKMDYDYFWNWVRELSKNNFVLVSEQNAPEDFEVIWEKKVNRTMSSNNNFKATEKLFKLKS